MNVQGEEQKKLDVVTNDVIKRALKFTGKVGVIASEEEDKPVFNKDAYRVPGGEGKYQDVLADIGSKYVTVFDPLDGSSNVRAHHPPSNAAALHAAIRLGGAPAAARLRGTHGEWLTSGRDRRSMPTSRPAPSSACTRRRSRWRTACLTATVRSRARAS